MTYLLGILLFLSSSVWAQEIKLPALRSPVMDQAGLLNESEREALAEFAYEIHAHQGPQITILIVPNLQGLAIEDFSIRVAEKWQLGTKEKGNGLLITIAQQERQMRIEVGEGIEGEITDFEANQYIKEILTPAFQKGNFYFGLRAVMEDIGQKFNPELAQSQSSLVRRSKSPHANNTFNIFFLVALVILVIGHIALGQRTSARGVFSGLGMTGTGFFLIPGIGGGALLVLFLLGLGIGLIGLQNILFAMASGRHRGGSGGFGGGGWSGGGGGFSGGGASGRW
jgi:uncharacterized protein